MSLDVYLTAVVETEVFEANITHNLNKMAEEAGIYYVLWRPDELGFTDAWQLVDLLETGLEKLVCFPTHYKQFNPENGWGNYDNLVSFVKKYIEHCRKYPAAKITVSR